MEERDIMDLSHQAKAQQAGLQKQISNVKFHLVIGANKINKNKKLVLKIHKFRKNIVPTYQETEIKDLTGRTPFVCYIETENEIIGILEGYKTHAKPIFNNIWIEEQYRNNHLFSEAFYRTIKDIKDINLEEFNDLEKLKHINQFQDLLTIKQITTLKIEDIDQYLPEFKNVNQSKEKIFTCLEKLISLVGSEELKSLQKLQLFKYLEEFEHFEKFKALEGLKNLDESQKKEIFDCLSEIIKLEVFKRLREFKRLEEFKSSEKLSIVTSFGFQVDKNAINKDCVEKIKTKALQITDITDDKAKLYGKHIGSIVQAIANLSQDPSEDQGKLKGLYDQIPQKPKHRIAFANKFYSSMPDTTKITPQICVGPTTCGVHFIPLIGLTEDFVQYAEKQITELEDKRISKTAIQR